MQRRCVIVIVDDRDRIAITSRTYHRVNVDIPSIIILKQQLTLHSVSIFYSIQNEDTDCRNPMLPIVYVCRMSTRPSFSIVCSTHCLGTLITAKKLNPLRSQTEEYQTPLVYLVNRNSISIWYQKHFLRPALLNFESKK